MLWEALDEDPPVSSKDKKNEFLEANRDLRIGQLGARARGEDIYVLTRNAMFSMTCGKQESLYPLEDVPEFLSLIARHEDVASARIANALAIPLVEISEPIRDRFAGLSFYLDADVGDGDAHLDAIGEVTFEGTEIVALNESTTNVEIACEVAFTDELIRYVQLHQLAFEDPDTALEGP